MLNYKLQWFKLKIYNSQSIILAKDEKSGGGDWIRTSEGIANGFTVRPL